MQSEFDAVPLDGYGVIGLSTHSSACKGDDLYQVKHLNGCCTKTTGAAEVTV